MEQIKLMLEKIETDKDFATEMQPLLEKKDVAAILAAAEKNGFNITVDDWQEYGKWVESLDTKNDAKKELSEEEMEAVAAGDKGAGATPFNPIKSDCWFIPSGNSEFRDGMSRKACNAYACVAYCAGSKGFGWYRCMCRGWKDNCVNCWHRTEGGHG